MKNTEIKNAIYNVLGNYIGVYAITRYYEEEKSFWDLESYELTDKEINEIVNEQGKHFWFNDTEVEWDLFIEVKDNNIYVTYNIDQEEWEADYYPNHINTRINILTESEKLW